MPLTGVLSQSKINPPNGDFFLFFGDSKNFVAPPPAKNPGNALGSIHIYLIELCYE